VPAYRFDGRQTEIIAETLRIARNLSEQFGYHRKAGPVEFAGCGSDFLFMRSG
jgi:hypothetical protein